MYCTKENVNILTALLVKLGVENIVVCPGSRNAPLVHNFNECPDIHCHPATDERSAGFIALGITQQTHRPVAVCVTSGSAVLNLLPAVAEATYQHTGIIVISADRPAAWIDQLDGQTLPQPGVLGGFVAKSVTLPEPHDDEERWYCNRLINEAFLAYRQLHRPSIHINVPITEPLFEFTVDRLPEERLVQCGRWSNDHVKDIIIGKLARAKKPMFVIGQTQQYSLPDDYLNELSRHFVILSEPISGGELPPSFTDQMLHRISKHPAAYKPDMVVFIGGHTVSKRLRQFLRSLDKDVTQIVFSDDTQLRDISKNTQYVIQGSMSDMVSDINGYLRHNARPTAFYKKWETLRREVSALHDQFEPAYSSMLAVKCFEESFDSRSIDEEDIKFYYGNSMSVRLAALYARHYCYCNRGLNGIEGSLSVAVGAALAQAQQKCEYDEPSPSQQADTFCIIGDLSFFYDENGLWQQHIAGNLRILLLNNSQGGIFRNLPGLGKSAACDSLVAARHTATAEGICQQFDVRYLKATDSESLETGIRELTMSYSQRPVLLEVITDVNIDEQEYKRYYANLI